MKNLKLLLLFLIIIISSALHASSNCSELLAKPIAVKVPEELKEDLLALQQCGHDLLNEEENMLQLIMLSAFSKATNPTYNDLVDAAIEMRSKDIYEKAVKNTAAGSLFQLLIIVLILSVFVFWGYMFFKHRSKPEHNEILDEQN